MSSRREDRKYKHTSKRHEDDDYDERRKVHRRHNTESRKSPERQHHRRNHSDSDDDKRKRQKYDKKYHSRHESNKSDADYEWGSKKESSDQKKHATKKEEPNFGTTGKLAEDTNTFNGVVIKYSEPAEARKPKRRWRLYPFKGEKQLPVLHIHRQSGYLLGRDRKVADIPIDHPSCSKQHAALQYRLIAAKKDGRHIRCIRPYIIDLESANGTYVNNQRIEPKKYVELMEKDVIKFGFSSREYVLLHEHSVDSGDDDSLAEDNPNEENN
ncbi:smad nuclear-interacting protein 1 isoform X2 [Daktulosphaira vitifoliae]|uniref:smad nuclear-interacting protein 1 isoform X2 n=1 Tax=Daktulosphaira vitifoliae TaxID=58002 RepID=UPI0021AA6675|nr:smad nuclear-interacting protein 1 isoform X2 [Daktulosphaira vitifoliae]